MCNEVRENDTESLSLPKDWLATVRNAVLNVETDLANTQVPQYQLFNLADDPPEQTNVIDKHPDVAARLKAQLTKIIEKGRSRS